MNYSHLRDRTILVTRPGGLSDHLRDNIAAAGGKAIHLPSMAIVPVAESSEAKQLLASVTDFDVLIFVSRNAVKYANELMPGLSDKVKDKTVFAVGTGTYEELEGVGFNDVSYTDSNTGSDALLDMEELQADNVKDKKIMIVRGVGGRELLGDKLVARGAQLQYAELYCRARPDVEPAVIKDIWLSEKPDAVLVTSVEGLRNLLEMTGEDEQPIFLNTRLVVISHRIKGAADSLGFCAAIKVATGYSDDDFLVALTELFEVNGNGR